MKWKITPVLVLLSFAWSVCIHAQSLHISVAASMTHAFQQLMAAFSQDHPEVQFIPNFASSGSLAKQIEQGAPTDIYVAANQKWLQYLVAEQLIAPGSYRIFAYNTLVFVGKKNQKVVSLLDLPRLDRIALGNPQYVPAGQYAGQAMKNSGIFHLLKQEARLVMAKDVLQALLYADRGEVDGAFVYKTDALLAGNAAILFTVPDNLYDRICYPVALTISGSSSKSANLFYAYLATAGAADILSEFGFEPAR